MTSAKDLRIEPIDGRTAAAFVRAHHYSRTVMSNSLLHFGAFLNGRLEGAIQFGPSMDKRKLIGLVAGTEWHNFLELNRLAFSDRLPKNSESRALGVCFRMMRKAYPALEWIVSFADATQCGDGAIYRASGFVLTGIRKNATMMRLPDGRIFANLTLNTGTWRRAGQTAAWWLKNGAEPLPGYQMRYLYFLNPAARERLTVPVIPFAEIDKLGAGMYRGEPKRSKQATADTIGPAAVTTPTRALHPSDEATRE